MIVDEPLSNSSSSWRLTDLAQVPSNGLTVMSTFACGGGSSMGYKLAGFDVIAANDIDPEMRWHYETNLRPSMFYECPIKDLVAMSDLPEQLFGLDVLDGSPPCSTFSMVGSREKAWGKSKHFREGQAEQVLDDLFFDFLDLAAKLKPKVIVAENVKGMLIGNARGYLKAIQDRLQEMGYQSQIFLLNAANCGEAQTRERVFICATRINGAPPVSVRPRERQITIAQACQGLDHPFSGGARKLSEQAEFLWRATRKGQCLNIADSKSGGKGDYFSVSRADERQPARTITATETLYHWDEPRTLSYPEVVRLGSFPDDYVVRNPSIGKYLIGMSVPPKMMRVVATAVRDQWLLPVASTPIGTST